MLRLMQYRITKPAQKAFEKIYDTFYEFARKRHADEMVERVDDRLKTLLKQPFIGHPETLLSNRSHDYRAISVNKNYRMIYYVSKDTIWIVDFWDRRNNPASRVARVK